ncbi:hypothetical protein [Herbidospora cretacea]|nr:hypothetical protein [Herbidospora cretacea]
MVGLYNTLRTAYEKELMRPHLEKLEPSREVTAAWPDNARMVLAGS